MTQLNGERSLSTVAMHEIIVVFRGNAAYMDNNELVDADIPDVLCVF